MSKSIDLNESMDRILDNNYIFKLTDLYFKQKNIMYTHLYNSFDKFLDHDVKNMLTEGDNIFFEKYTNDKIYRYRFKFDNISIKPPILDNEDDIMYPMHARTRNLTYAVNLVATITQHQDVVDISSGDTVTRQIGTPEYEYPIATIPVMVRSKYCSLNIKKGDKSECSYDPGGYFIVNGSEKVVMTLERMCDNKPFVSVKKDSSNLIYTVQTNSKSQSQVDMTQITTVRMGKDGKMLLRVPILNEVPVVTVIRALGVETDRDIVNMIVYDETDTEMINLVRLSLEELTFDNSKQLVNSKESAYMYLINKLRVTKRYSDVDKDVRIKEKKIHLDNLLTNNFLPHVTGGMYCKAYYLGYMINRLLNCYLGRIPKDDRDSYINKRLDLPGTLLFDLFKQHYKKMLNECSRFFKKRNNNDENPLVVINQIKPNVIEQGLKRSLLSGMWGKKKGVAQILQRTTYMNAISSLRRVNSPTVDASTNKLTSPRHIHGTQIGYICNVETPEGHNVGLVKNLALMSNVTVTMNSQIYVLKEFFEDKVQSLHTTDPVHMKKYVKVFLNGEWLGVVKDVNNALKLYKKLKNMKYNGNLDATTSVTYNIDTSIESRELRVNCDNGRLYRPILRVENNNLLLTKALIDNISTSEINKPTMINSWNEFMVKNPGVVEYVDVDEAFNAMISMNSKKVYEMNKLMIESSKLMKGKFDFNSNYSVINRYDNLTYVKYTHCEIHPSMLLGMVAANIPFCNHNQGPRNMYQYSQARHAMGIYSSNYQDRLDISYILYNVQRPIVTTRTMKYINTDMLPFGENCIVAIACYSGYNQEDSVIMNQSAIDRGLFRSTTMKKYSLDIQKNQSTSEDDIFAKPDKSRVDGMRPGSYDKLGEEGHPPEETRIIEGDAVIGKISPVQPVGNSGKTFKDKSKMYDSGVPGTVDKVWTDVYNQEGYEVKKIRMRSERVPHIGDKFCCYTPEHEVLTTNGWIPVKDISYTHKIASLVDGKLMYQTPTDIQEYDYNGKIYCVKSDHVDLRTTPNHRMYVSDGTKFGIELAEDIFGLDRYYKKNVETVINTFDKNSFTIPSYYNYYHSKSLDIDLWLMFLGTWLSTDNVGTGVVFSNCSTKKKNVVRYCCKMMELETELMINGDISVKDKQVVDYIKYMGVNKFIPYWCWNFSKDNCRTLLEGIMIDSKYIGDKRVYVTQSSKFADDIQRLCLHAGWSANISYEHHIGYIVSINEKDNSTLVNAQNDSYIDYKGKVYCCTVKGEGVIYVRRKGTPVWCGQSRHGQKGTIGITLPSSDMPFTKDGVQPDIIMNPNAIPSRMTMGQLVECLVGKVAALKGVEMDGTPFNELDLDDIREQLEKLGYQKDGNEYLYNGMTGRKIKTMIFIGPTYYQRLRHMVSDKIHARAHGPITLLTRQPPEGRSRDGGLRFGEMERDSIIAHGMSRFLKERMLETADGYVTHVCDVCGLFAQRMKRENNKPYTTHKDIFFCPSCRNKTKISKVVIPYAFKLLIQEMMSMNIAPRMVFDKNKFD